MGEGAVLEKWEACAVCGQETGSTLLVSTPAMVLWTIPLCGYHMQKMERQEWRLYLLEDGEKVEIAASDMTHKYIPVK